MRTSKQFLILISSVILLSEAKTYFFNRNKTSNEYMIRTRIHFNDSDYYGVRLGELRNNVTRKNIPAQEQNPHPSVILDPEWNYNWTNATREKLPVFITHYHDHFAKVISNPVRFLFNKKPNSTILKFNLSSLADESANSVELHFFHKIDKSLIKDSLILRLYQMDSKFLNDSYIINPDTHKLLNVIYVYQAEGGWQVFKLTNALQTHLQNKTELLLFITVSKPNKEQFSFFKDNNKGPLRTFLAIKTESHIKSLETNETVIQDSSCVKRSLNVNLTKLHWDKFIISPLEFNAFNCYGTCYRSNSVTNHAKVTSHLPEIARKTLCCVPTHYLPLPIMFYDKNEDVAIKIYEDMIILNCGCR